MYKKETYTFVETLGLTRGLAVEILEIFENMLEEKGIMIPDEDRTDDEGKACFVWGNVWKFGRSDS